MTATITGIDVVEVLRGTSAGPWLVAAGAVGGVAAVATVVAVVAWWAGDGPHRHEDVERPAPAHRGRRDAMRRSLALAAVASALEVALLLADGAGLDDRWVLVVAVRLLVLLSLLGTHGADRQQARPALPVPVRAGLTLVLLTTAAMGAPLAAVAGRLAVAAAVVGGVLTVVALVWWALVRTERVPATAAALLLMVVVGGPTALWSAPDAVPPHHQERVTVDGLVLDVTVAPVQAGTNEAHVYAFDPEGRPVPVTDVELAVAGVPDSAHPMFEVSPDHHLSYVLELPADPPWNVSITLRGDDDRRRAVTLQLDRP